MQGSRSMRIPLNAGCSNIAALLSWYHIPARTPLEHELLLLEACSGDVPAADGELKHDLLACKLLVH